MKKANVLRFYFIKTTLILIYYLKLNIIKNLNYYHQKIIAEIYIYLIMYVIKIQPYLEVNNIIKSILSLLRLSI